MKFSISYIDESLGIHAYVTSENKDTSDFYLTDTQKTLLQTNPQLLDIIFLSQAKLKLPLPTIPKQPIEIRNVKDIDF